MELSIFLAKFLGIYMLAMSFLFAIRRDAVRDFVHGLVVQKGLMGLSGVLALMLGIAIAIAHPVWEWSWRGFITVFGYFAILQGIVRIGFPEYPRRLSERALTGNGIYVFILVLFLLGAYLTYTGFTV